ncbi:hypothetical protein NN3_11040 [Nocardia neocaledoniensis NBRC 108232]|uniref:Uncharacterized protein n=1 Tax=Nocardia neocaledoniensis TaxID=236511 RepID=A0A317NZC8_9NOCA|nr:hypothetical protein DFR69_102587 [Nocardia neocaledoniensis]GEM30097.1 hypothetical protein NN3_11040 [Nocardia neocaledoniensis NBRC 108232]
MIRAIRFREDMGNSPGNSSCGSSIDRRPGRERDAFPRPAKVAGRRGSSIRSRKSSRSILSYRSEGSILSIGSAYSILSIGSVGSVLSVGSVGSFGSLISSGSFASIGSALSGLSRWSLLSWRGVLAEPEGRPTLRVVPDDEPDMRVAGATCHCQT